MSAAEVYGDGIKVCAAEGIGGRCSSVGGETGMERGVFLASVECARARVAAGQDTGVIALKRDSHTQSKNKKEDRFNGQIFTTPDT